MGQNWLAKKYRLMSCRRLHQNHSKSTLFLDDLSTAQYGTWSKVAKKDTLLSDIRDDFFHANGFVQNWGYPVIGIRAESGWTTQIFGYSHPPKPWPQCRKHLENDPKNSTSFRQPLHTKFVSWAWLSHPPRVRRHHLWPKNTGPPAFQMATHRLVRHTREWNGNGMGMEWEWNGNGMWIWRVGSFPSHPIQSVPVETHQDVAGHRSTSVTRGWILPVPGLNFFWSWRWIRMAPVMM